MSGKKIIGLILIALALAQLRQRAAAGGENGSNPGAAEAQQLNES